MVGGSGGSGVLLVKDDKTGEWSPPAFYTLGGASFGLQIGGEVSEVVLLVTTQKGLDSMLT
jgi:SH3 domain-containing YSC84-like protein 1